MYGKIETWLNNVLEHKVPSEIPSVIRAFCFNLYEDENDVWFIELVGTESFDPDDEDWACDEITDFGTREEPLSWKKKTDWNEVLSEVSSALKHYLENGLHADVLKSRMGVAVGFTDGNLEILYSDLSDMAQAGIPYKSSIMPASKSEIPEFKSGLPSRYYSALAHREKSSEPAKKAVKKRMTFLLAFVIILWLSACLYFLYLHIRDTAADRQDPEKTTLENNTGQAEEKNEEIYVPATTMPDAALDSYTLIYDGRDTGLEIFLEDCTCEFNRGASIQLYSCFVDDDALDAKGYAIYIRTPEEVIQFFPVKDYLVDKSAGRLYMLRGMETFEGIEGVDFVNGINGFMMKDTYSIEGLIGDAYGLKLSESNETFDDLQVEFIGLYQEKGKTLLRGKASALYHITGKRYTIDWEINTESLQENTKAFLADFDIHPLYAAFLRNEISVKNPFVPEDSDYSKLSFFDDMEDEDEPLVYWKSFSLVDVNGDGNAELLFKMINSPSEEMYILGVQDDELICFDILLTHTTHMSFRVCDNGIVVWGQNYDGAEVVYYTFNDKGKEQELIHFVREENSDSELYYDFYYLEGNEESRINLQSNEEYENLVSSYEGEEPEWFDCDSFADIPRTQLIAETEIVEKNAKNTNELRISTGITRLWLNEDEEGAAKINAALREIYEAAEAEMEAYNQEILDEYLFEDGVLYEDLDEWLLYPLDEWLAISEENYEASIEYVDENYLCLSMNGDNFVAGGAHGYYWSDYYVFNRHTGQRLSLEDFVNNSAEEIKEIVKTRIFAVAPYSKGEQSEYALEQNRFFLTAEGLGIHYDVYEISDYASGSFDLIIPFKLFDMKEDMWPGRTLTFYEKELRFEEE